MNLVITIIIVAGVVMDHDSRDHDHAYMLITVIGGVGLLMILVNIIMSVVVTIIVVVGVCAPMVIMIMTLVSLTIIVVGVFMIVVIMIMQW